MDSTPVNWDALDALILDFARSERLIIDDDANPSSSTFRSRLLIRRIRRAVESGDVEAAIELLRARVPEVLEDHRLLFRLQKQRFVELLRSGKDEDRDKALKCLRSSLAPVALDAYPEAYEEFKHVLLALVFGDEDHNSPVANEWSEKRRSEIAGHLCSVLTAHLHAYDPIFAMTLRYLISIHKVFCLRQGIQSPISDLTQRLLFEDRDPPAIPLEGLHEAPPFDEVDIQALAHAVELTRQGAVDSLKFVKGNLFEAFQNELCRMKLDVAVLDELVHEYCVYRGIVDTVRATPSDCGTCRSSDGETSVSNVDVEGDQAANMSKQASDEVRSSNEDCSTSDMNQPEGYSRKFRRGRRHAIAQNSRRKRWRGRILDSSAYANFIENDNMELRDSTGTGDVEEEQISSHSSMENVDDHKYEIILEMRELTYKGMTEEVVEEVNARDPDFFAQNPTLLFQLKQVEFLKLVSSGDFRRALKIASFYLGPLAASNQHLLKPLKETLFVLLRPDEDLSTRATPLSLLATSLQVAFSGRLGIDEPQLMKIIRATLHTHNEWFKLQMCKDRFEGMLKIDLLKEIDIPVTSDAISRAQTDNCTDRSSQVSDSSGGRVIDISSTAPFSSGDVCDESAILKVMEFLALPRADAIHLLSQYNGNAEAAIQQIFS